VQHNVDNVPKPTFDSVVDNNRRKQAGLIKRSTNYTPPAILIDEKPLKKEQKRHYQTLPTGMN